ncbi:VanZ family protein [Niallia circulans]|uniref:VanZ family protein n=1 Tax=Niallia circulans TaxID=1397 RepID=UPI001F18B687|nr:VanZ family protein [Niallia circulans]MCF2649298.1 VanZ family protein [Niallia circulans]
MIQMYLESMLIYMIFGAPIYLICRTLYIRLKKQEWKWNKEILLFLFVLFCIGVASQTIIPQWYMSMENGKQKLYIQRLEGGRSINLIPFSTIFSYLAISNEQVSNWNQVSLINLLGNVVVFVPFGIFLPLLWRQFRKFFPLFWMSISIPLFIEITQLFIGRSTDIDDVLLNALGIIFGYCLFQIFNALFPKRLVELQR